MLAGEIDEQALEELDLDVVEVGRRLLQHLLALLEAEQRLRLLRIADHGDDDDVEVPGRALDDVEVAQGDWIEGPRAEGGRHAGLLSVQLVESVEEGHKRIPERALPAGPEPFRRGHGGPDRALDRDEGLRREPSGCDERAEPSPTSSSVVS